MQPELVKTKQQEETPVPLLTEVPGTILRDCTLFPLVLTMLPSNLPSVSFNSITVMEDVRGSLYPWFWTPISTSRA